MAAIGDACTTASDCLSGACMMNECSENPFNSEEWQEFGDAAGKAVTVWIIMVVLFCLCIVGCIVCCVCGIGFCAAKGAQAAAESDNFQRSE